jgi:hypothetical protein
VRESGGGSSWWLAWRKREVGTRSERACCDRSEQGAGSGCETDLVARESCSGRRGGEVVRNVGAGNRGRRPGRGACGRRCEARVEERTRGGRDAGAEQALREEEVNAEAVAGVDLGMGRL